MELSLVGCGTGGNVIPESNTNYKVIETKATYEIR